MFIGCIPKFWGPCFPCSSLVWSIYEFFNSLVFINFDQKYFWSTQLKLQSFNSNLASVCHWSPRLQLRDLLHFFIRHHGSLACTNSLVYWVRSSLSLQELMRKNTRAYSNRLTLFPQLRNKKLYGSYTYSLCIRDCVLVDST